MKCITHIQREAECYCPICKQPICGECRDYLITCIYCAERECIDIKKEFWVTIILSLCTAVMGICYVVAEFGSIPWELVYEGYQKEIVVDIISRIAIVFGCTCVPFGWRALNRISPNIFLILPLAGWAIYFIVKFFICISIGWILAIPKCISMYKNLKLCKKRESNIKRIKKELYSKIII